MDCRQTFDRRRRDDGRDRRPATAKTGRGSCSCTTATRDSRSGCSRPRERYSASGDATCTRPRSSSRIRGLSNGSRASRCGTCGPTCSACCRPRRAVPPGRSGPRMTVRNGDYDLICIGSPTWWRTMSMPMRSFLKSDEARKLLVGKPFAVFVVCRRIGARTSRTVRKLAEQQGGRYVGRNPFHVSRRPGSLHAVADQLPGVSGQYRDRYLGVRIPPTNIQPEQLEQTRTFASGLADRLFGAGPASPGDGSSR